MDLSVNLTNTICRICFNKINKCTKIIESFEIKNILQKISSCFQIFVDFEKYLPCVICPTCIEDLNIANSLKIKCLTIDERFKTYCEDISKKIVVTITNKENAITQDNNNLNINVKDSITDNEDNNLDRIEVEKSTSVNTFICDKCSKVLKTKKSLLRHIVSMHDNKKRVGKVTGSGVNRRHHCTSCPYFTPHSQTLINHMRRHTNERPYKCECGKTFTQASALTAHSKTHSDTVYFTCHLCGKQFKHAHLLKRHLTVTHNDGNFKCSICYKLLKSKSNLEIHIRRHNKHFSYNCKDCDRAFVTPSELRNHRVKHSKDNKFICNICDFCTNSKKNIVAHLKRHEGNKKFNCNYCTKAFLTQVYLKRHMRVHTKEKQYSCANCSQRFTYSSSLNRHMLLMHGINYKWGDVKFKESRMLNITV